MLHRWLAITCIFASSACLNFDFKKTEALNKRSITVTAEPQLVESNPKTGSQDVSIGTTLELFFSVDMAPETLVVTASPTASTRFLRWQPETRGALFLFEESLTVGTTYTFEVSGKTADGAELTGNRTVSFSTVAPVAIVAPTIVTAAPANGATGVALDASLSVTFSAAMEPSSVTLTSALLTIPEPVWNEANTQVTWDLPTLTEGTNYVFEVSGRDLNGVDLGGSRVISFTTLAVTDETPPMMVFHTPANQTGNAINLQSLTMTFNEPMLAASATPGTVTISNGAPACVLSWAGESQLVCTLPNADNFVFNQSYTVTLSSLLTDLAGNPLAPPYTFSFTTDVQADVIAPKLVTWGITAFSPGVTPPTQNPWPNPSAIDTRGVDPASYIDFGFSEEVKSLGDRDADDKPYLRLMTGPKSSLSFTVQQLPNNVQRVLPVGGTNGTLIEWVVSPTLTDTAGRAIDASMHPLSGKWRYIDYEIVELVSDAADDGWLHPNQTSTTGNTMYTGWERLGGDYNYMRSFVTFPLGTLRSTITQLVGAELRLCQRASSSSWGTPFTTLGPVYFQTVSYGTSLDAGDYDGATDECPAGGGLCAVNGTLFTSTATSSSSDALRTKDVTNKVASVLSNTARSSVQFRFTQPKDSAGIPPSAAHYTGFYTGDTPEQACVGSSSRRPTLKVRYNWLGASIPP